MFLLTNAVQEYAWGSVDALPDLLGVPKSGKPQAELWIGAHPSAPSMAWVAGEQRPLSEVVAADPHATLGDRTVRRLGDELPFLLKILCAASPLSLQAHPSKAQAEAGYAAENAAGTPVAAPDRNYKDANHKPELIYALTRFEALCGFARPQDSRAVLIAIRERTGPLRILDALIDDLAGDDQSALRSATERLLTLDGTAARTAVAAVVAACSGLAGAAATTAVELGEAYPGDAGVVLSLLLNRVSLVPGEALFLPAGNIHAYLRGTGIEIMATSDNVLRGGLTTKHIDVPELLAILDFTPTASAAITPVAGGGALDFRPPVDDFRLSVIEIDDGQSIRWDEPVPRTAIVIEGEFTLSSAAGDLGLTRGEAVFVPAAEAPLVVRGRGRLAAAAPNV
ncbi:MAG: mannose-6-phosphate isomerase, class I [Mycobacteriales bacterium]